MQEFVENYYSFEITVNLVESDSDHEDDFDEIDSDHEDDFDEIDSDHEDDFDDIDIDHEDDFDDIDIDFEVDENTEPEEREKEKPKEIPVVNTMEEKIEFVLVIDSDDDNDKCM